jgi:hypothetical protein
MRALNSYRNIYIVAFVTRSDTLLKYSYLIEFSLNRNKYLSSESVLFTKGNGF